MSGSLIRPEIADFLMHTGIGLLSNNGKFGPGVAQGAQTYLQSQAQKVKAAQDEQRFQAGLDLQQQQLASSEENQRRQYGLNQDRMVQDGRQFDQRLSFDSDSKSRDFALREAQLKQARDLAVMQDRGAMDRAQLAARAGAGGSFQFGEYQDGEGRPIVMKQHTKTGDVVYQLPDGTISKVAPDGMRTNSVGNDWAKSGLTPVKDILEAGYRAESTLPKLKGALQVMEKNPGLYTGVGGEAVQMWRTLASAWNPEAAQNAADVDQLRQVFFQGVLDISAQAKGPTSDRDIALFKAATAGLDKSPESNKRMLEMAVKMTEKSLKYADHMAEKAPRYGYDKARKLWSENNPIEPLTGSSPLDDPAKVDSILKQYFPN
jgi:hypothetical protein